jgi:putative membrane protein
MMGTFGWGLGMPVFMVLFWGLIIWGVVALVRWAASPGISESTTPRVDSPLEMLKRRYARGEISRAEFEEMKRDLA